MLRSLAAALAALLATAAVADEGMWTFDNVPQAAIQSRYGVKLDKPWLERLHRLVRVARRAGAHQSPLRHVVPRAALQPD